MQFAPYLIKVRFAAVSGGVGVYRPRRCVCLCVPQTTCRWRNSVRAEGGREGGLLATVRPPRRAARLCLVNSKSMTRRNASMSVAVSRQDTFTSTSQPACRRELSLPRAPGGEVQDGCKACDRNDGAQCSVILTARVKNACVNLLCPRYSLMYSGTVDVHDVLVSTCVTENYSESSNSLYERNINLVPWQEWKKLWKRNRQVFIIGLTVDTRTLLKPNMAFHINVSLFRPNLFFLLP